MNGDGLVAMEVDPPLHISASPDAHARSLTSQDRSRNSQDRIVTSQDRSHTSQDRLHTDRVHSSHAHPESFELTTEQIKRVLTFGKDLQSLYDCLTAQTPNEKFKVLLQVYRVILV